MIDHQLAAMRQVNRDPEEQYTSGDVQAVETHRLSLASPIQDRPPSQAGKDAPEDDKPSPYTSDRDTYTPTTDGEKKAYLPSLGKGWDAYRTSDSSAESSQQQSRRSQASQEGSETQRRQRKYSLSTSRPP